MYLLMVAVASACECGIASRYATEAELWALYVNRAEVVAVGHVTSVDESERLSATTVRIETAYKGVEPGASIVLHHLRGGRSCGFPTAVGDPISVFIVPNEDSPGEVDACMAPRPPSGAGAATAANVEHVRWMAARYGPMGVEGTRAY